ncbi:hypothetical protein L218DRAFT_1008480 [Marasmius fiardii PR-910]|nr:hypothetical protein L218DRAFT_1008480 [Marasmius fiardii PR-910]
MPTRTVVSTARTVNSTRPSSSTAPVQFSTPSSIPRPVNTTARESSPAYHTPSNKSDSEALPTHAEGPRSNSDPDAQSTGTVRENFNASPSHNSLFSQPSVTAEEIFEETNRAAIRRGKKSMPTLLKVFKPRLFHDSRVRNYFSELHRRYVLQMLRRHDLMAHNRIHHILRADLSEPATPIEDAEIAKLRVLYPEPFSENDRNSSRRPPKFASIGFTGSIPDLNGKEVSSGSGNAANSRRHASDNSGSDTNRFQSGYRDTPPHLRHNHGGAGGNPGDPDPSDHEGPPSDSDDDVGSERTVDYGSEDNRSPEDVNLQNRYTSAEPTLIQKREWVYDPTPQSEGEMLKAAFRPLEELIDAYLLCDPVKGNGNIQKTLLQSIPKPGSYNGQNNLTIFDD